MNDAFPYGDLLLLALIAGFVVLRLRSTLGKDLGIKPGEMWKQASRDTTKEKVFAFPDRQPKKPDQPAAEDVVVPPSLQLSETIAKGLRAIKVADASFSTTEFLNGSKVAFEWVVDAFAKGERDKLQMLLSEERFKHFTQALDVRATTPLKQETTLVSIVATDITEAHFSHPRAQITLQFTSEQVHVVRDAQGNIVEGNPSAVEQVIDLWTFERDVTSRDPNWKIVAT